MLNFEALDRGVWNVLLGGVEAALLIQLLVLDKAAAVGPPCKEESEKQKFLA